MANLAAQIAHWQDRDPPGTAAAACRRERSEQRAFDPDRRQGLIDALATRARVRLSAADRRCAVALADDWVRRAPDDPRAWLSQAANALDGHRIVLAATALARARALGAEPEPSLACQLAHARGDYTEALACARTLAKAHDDAAAWGRLATVLGEVGEYREARAAFARARAGYRDPSPLIPAWLAQAEARMWARAGNRQLAEVVLRAGRERLPQHLGLALEHAVALEQLGEHEEAIRLASPLLERTRDPDVPAQLAAWHQAAGRSEKAAALARQARAGFAAHLDAEPAAYVAHAAEFWLSAGDRPREALALAQRNARHAPTLAALALLAEAAAAAGEHGLQCTATARVLEIGRHGNDRGGDSLGARMRALRQGC